MDPLILKVIGAGIIKGSKALLEKKNSNKEETIRENTTKPEPVVFENTASEYVRVRTLSPTIPFDMLLIEEQLEELINSVIQEESSKGRLKSIVKVDMSRNISQMTLRDNDYITVILLFEYLKPNKDKTIVDGYHVVKEVVDTSIDIRNRRDDRDRDRD